MATLAYAAPPTYISSRSADVILSDIRPTKLCEDALSAINVLLDELLYSILDAARALTTKQLRAGLNKVLPTTLGKEAVLEAEMELRAYWERTGGAPGTGPSQVAHDDGSFNLAWAFELLRLKCEAYSTLSDTDENSEAEAHLIERMNAEGTPVPKQSLLAPASLYLTAIIESICEHILSNVGRVVARDSSRATANAQDLFVALCEDSMIYGLFRSMKVYEEIESLSKLPNGRRSLSKSFSRERLTGTASPSSESFRKDSPRNGPRQRMSSESSHTSPSIVVNANHQSTRSSLEKSRAIKIFNNRALHDSPNGSEPQNGHNKSDSYASASAKQSFSSISDRSPVSPTFGTFGADPRSLEFDDMMRSGSTMKVSLTPDRLRTMEVPNKEKPRQQGRQKGSTKTEKASNIDGFSISSPDQKRSARTALRPVDSINEDDEDTVNPKPPPPPSRPRQLSAATAASYRASSFIRMRSTSTSDPTVAVATVPNSKHSSRSESESPNLPAQSVPKRKVPPKNLTLNATKSPLRRPARNPESLDLDEVMGDSDEEIMLEMDRKRPSALDKHKGFSENTRDLISFLAEGPPQPPVTPSFSNDSSLSLTPKKSGRLHKMISRITLTSATESNKASRRMTGSHEVVLSPNKSASNLSPLANRPVPPRYPTSGSPSATSSERGSADQDSPNLRQRSQSAPRISTPENGRAFEKESPPLPSIPIIVPEIGLGNSSPAITKKFSDPILSRHVEPSIKSSHVESPRPGSGRAESVVPTSPDISAPPSTASSVTRSPPVEPAPAPAPAPYVPARVSSKSATACSPPPHSHSPSPPPTPAIPEPVAEQARAMRRVLAHATNVHECRLLVDIFLMRSQLVSDPAELRALDEAAPLDPATRELNTMIEKTVVGLFLGDNEPVFNQPDAGSQSVPPLINGHAAL